MANTDDVDIREMIDYINKSEEDVEWSEYEADFIADMVRRAELYDDLILSERQEVFLRRCYEKASRNG